MRYTVRGMALAAALVLAGTAQAQYPDQPPPPPFGYAPPPPDAPPPGAVQPLYGPPQLDQMLASIALYPDPLLTSILTAATYPLEVVSADRWVADPRNAALRDGALAGALQYQSWDPSVKSLVPFPQLLHLMDAHLDWTQALGNAFLAQQADVMDSIQRLRHAAMAAGTLFSNPQESVVVDGPYIQIEPASPQLVYIPVYNPAVVYGSWPYPAYLPIYYGPPPGLGISFATAGIGFGIGIAVVDTFWNWGRWDWRDHDVRVDRERFNRINVGRPPVQAPVWQHDPAHRQAVPYRDPQTRARFERPVPGSPDERRDYRGYPPQQQQQQQQQQQRATAPAVTPQAQPPQRSPEQQRATAPAVTPQAQPPQRSPEPQRATAPAVSPQAQPPQRSPEPQRATAPPVSPQAQPPQRSPEQQREPGRRPAAPVPAAPVPAAPVPAAPQPPQAVRVQPPQPASPVPQAVAPAPAPQARAPAPVQSAPQRPATAFQNPSRGADAQAVSQRGQESRHAPPAPTVAATAAPAATPAAQRPPQQNAPPQPPQQPQSQLPGQRPNERHE